jgi:hypothetical protein
MAEPTTDKGPWGALGWGQVALICTLLLALGAVAAFGVPALQARATSDEAVETLARLARRAAVYYVKPRGGAEGRAPCAFPVGYARTTLAASCCDPSVAVAGTHRCDPDKLEWDKTVWNTLRFELDEPHAYIYEYRGEGELGDARFELSAYADLDCDGTFSTFRYVGQGDPRSRSDDCVLQTVPVFTTHNVGE